MMEQNGLLSVKAQFWILAIFIFLLSMSSLGDFFFLFGRKGKVGKCPHFLSIWQVSHKSKEGEIPAVGIQTAIKNIYSTFNEGLNLCQVLLCGKIKYRI